jgi:hypothetical protein
MLRLIAKDGTVKKEFPAAVNVQYVGKTARLWSAAAKMVAEIKLQDGETIG